MRFLYRSEVRPYFDGKRVAIVGSGPGVLDNESGHIDGHDVVVRVNNYKLLNSTGRRTDVFYSFFGSSIKKKSEELRRDGTRLCMCKCPNAHAIESEWHRRHNKMIGVDYRPHYDRRRDWWFCDTYIPTVEEFLTPFELLGRHVPTTGFAAIFEILSHNPREVYLTGFDFFRSKIHNVDEAWRAGIPDDPFCHMPEREMAWLAEAAARYPISFDKTLSNILTAEKMTAA